MLYIYIKIIYIWYIYIYISCIICNICNSNWVEIYVMIYHNSWSYKPTYKIPKAPWKCGCFRPPGCLPASPCRRSRRRSRSHRCHRCHLRRRRSPGMKDAVTAPWTKKNSKNPCDGMLMAGKCFYYTRSLGPLQTWNSMWEMSLVSLFSNSRRRSESSLLWRCSGGEWLDVTRHVGSVGQVLIGT